MRVRPREPADQAAAQAFLARHDSARVARLGKLRPGPVGVAITLYDIWRRLPPKQRKQAFDLARKHGPKVASRVLQASARARARRKDRRR